MSGYKACNLIRKETLTQVFSCEFSEISKNTFSYRKPLVAASGSNSLLTFGGRIMSSEFFGKKKNSNENEN